MPDKRRHRGPHPADAALFSDAAVPQLRVAVADLSWLLTRGYSDTAALELVGDRFQLHRRARVAVRRCAATAPAVVERRRRRRASVVGCEVDVDGFNVLITIEAALGGGVLLRGVDGLVRDLSSVHGTYRRVEETRRAAELLLTGLAGTTRVRWLLDRPVGNSGRTAALLRELGAEEVELRDDVDAELKRSSRVVCTADGPILDRAAASHDLVGRVLQQLGCEVTDLGSPY